MTVLVHFWEHQLWRFRASFRTTILSGLVGPLVYLLGIGIGIGTQVDVDAAGLSTGRYLDFVGPGLMAAAAMQLGASEGLWVTAGALKWQGNYLSIVSTPLGIGQLFIGHTVWVGFRALVGAVAFLLVLVLFGVPTLATTVLTPFVAALTAMAFVAPISAWTGWVTSKGDSDQSFPMIFRLFILPAYLFSGAFYPIEDLPTALTWIGRVLPVWHGVELSRGLMVDVGLTAGVAAIHLGVLLAYIALGAIAGARTFTLALGQ
ncbi:MAG: ABC transporter permease [Actinomycetota bacterium]